MSTDEVVTLHCSAAQKALIDSVARVLGKPPAAFVLDAAVRRAGEVLTDRTEFQLSPEQWEAFTKLLDAPVQHNPALDRLLNTPAPWEKH